CVMDYLPGLAAKVTGVDIQEYSFVAPFEGKVQFEWDGEQAEAAVFMDCLTPVGENTEVLATFADGLYAGKPALTCNPFGKGKAYYFGGGFALDTAELFISKLELANPYKDVLEIPASVELAVREKDGKQYLFLLNYPAQETAITIKRPLRELISGDVLNGKVTMKPYEVFVFVL
ncbi:MAG: beta-galactosidase trimerization domain-containing protein, partial [Roseburia sp.]|nr:beta-galactosidase trimerization domain-containing protein [Roseburia sp.]